MTQKIKIIVLAFSALMVKVMIDTVLGSFITDNNWVRFISNILVIVIGSLYLKVVVGPFEPKLRTNKLFIVIAFLSITVFSFVSLFTTRSIIIAISESTAVLQDTGSQTYSDLFSIFISIFLAPVAEEIVYRGFMYRQLSSINKFSALIISACVFAVSHGTIYHLYTCIIGGLIFAWVYDKTHKLIYSIALHELFNTLTVVLSLINFSDVTTQTWFIFAVNTIQFLFVLMLFLMKSDSIIIKQQDKRILTAQEKNERDELKRVVNSVLSESKHK